MHIAAALKDDDFNNKRLRKMKNLNIFSHTCVFKTILWVKAGIQIHFICFLSISHVFIWLIVLFDVILN